MFKKPVNDTFGYADKNNFSYQPDYNSVMKFIRGNHKIPDSIKKAEVEERDHIDTLLENYKNYEHPIYTNPNVQIYALSLFKNNQITYENFLNIHLNLFVLMQFTNKQALKELKEGEENPKRITEIKIFSLGDEETKKIFTASIKEKQKVFYPTTTTFDEKSFSDLIDKLPDAGKNVIGIKISDFDIKNDLIFAVMNIFISDTPFFAKDNEYFYIPSSQFINLLIKMVNETSPIEMAAIFGIVNQQTLYQMHQKGFHPLSLYSMFVRDNLNNAHQYVSGPFCILMHDLYHVWSGNLLPKNQYNFIFEYFIPKVSELLKIKQSDVSEDKYHSFFYTSEANFHARIAESNAKITTPHYILYRIIFDLIFTALSTVKTKEILREIFKDDKMLQDKYNIDLIEIIKNETTNDDRLNKIAIEIKNELENTMTQENKKPTM